MTGRDLRPEEQEYVQALWAIWRQWDNAPAFLESVGVMAGATWAEALVDRDEVIDQKQVFALFRAAFKKGYRLQMQRQGS